jgi:hypothetical protein
MISDSVNTYLNIFVVLLEVVVLLEEQRAEKDGVLRESRCDPSADSFYAGPLMVPRAERPL